MRFYFISAILSTSIFFACGPSESTSTETIEPEISTTQATPKLEQKKPAPKIEEQLFELVQDWLTAQNEGNFSNYSVCYSDDFSGIKRAGAQTKSYDKAGWLTDRGRMFNKPMIVKASSIKIKHEKTPYEITFNQSWQSGTYQDYGPKILLLDKDLKIINEEMVKSNIIKPNGNIKDALDHPDFYVRHGDLLVLKENLSPGKLIETRESCQDYHNNDYNLCVTSHHHQPVSLSDDLLQLIGQQVFLGHVADEFSSETKISDIRVVSTTLDGELPGINTEGSIFESAFSWTGGGNITFASCLKNTTVKAGQWAFRGTQEPMFYELQSPEEDDILLINPKYEEEQYMTEGYSQFTNGIKTYIIAYHIVDECGNEYKDQVSIWELKNSTVEKMSDLPDVPIMVLDLDLDGDLDLLYEVDFTENPTNIIQWQAPYYYKNGEDTLFAGCGC